MLRRPIFGLGLGILIAAVVLAMAPRPGRASDPQEKAAHGTQKAEAEPGHAAGGHGDAAGGHGGEGEGKVNPMALQPSLALWTVVVFLGLFFILSRFAWKPLSQALHQREEHLEHCLLQTEKARNESEQLLAEHRRLMSQAGDQVKALIEKAQKDAQASADEIVRLAQSEATASRERAERDIGTARDQALAEIWGQTANLAVSVAGRVLDKQMNEDEHRRLLDMAIKELPAVGSANGHGGKSS
jgi:F-type H+-transporting ATPase subunit b